MSPREKLAKMSRAQVVAVASQVATVAATAGFDGMYAAASHEDRAFVAPFRAEIIGSIEANLRDGLLKQLLDLRGVVTGAQPPAPVMTLDMARDILPRAVASYFQWKARASA